MLGGYQILDLRGIDLTKGSVASNITNAYVLKQLLQLRDHIDKAYDFSKPLTNQLKPVLIRFRDKKSGEKTEGATFGELSVNGNYYTFKITARISGALVLTINVAFEEITNDYGNKEWVIDTATILLKDESKSITGDLELSGDLSVGDGATITGDASVGGSLSVTGKITGGEIVENMEGYSAQLGSNENFTWENVYTSVVKNGNKITFVSAINITRSASVGTSVTMCNFTIPTAIGNKLYPANMGGYQALSFHKVNAVTSTGVFIPINILLLKNSATSVGVVLQADTVNDLTLDTKCYIRVEATFLLSDNLIS